MRSYGCSRDARAAAVQGRRSNCLARSRRQLGGRAGPTLARGARVPARRLPPNKIARVQPVPGMQSRDTMD